MSNDKERALEKSLKEYGRKLAENAPPLSAEQRARIIELLRPTR